MKQILMYIALALLLFTGSAHAADACGVVFSSDMLSIFALGILISVLLISLWYMAGMFLGSPDIEATMKLELQQVGLTLVIALIIGGSLQVLCNVNITPEGLDVGTKENLISTVDKNLLGATKTTLNAYLDMSQGIFDYAKVGSIYGGISSVGVSIMFAPFSIYSSVAQAISPVTQMTLIAYFSLVFQYSLFKMTQSAVFLYLLPIGLTLRAFPISRKFGGVLVAVCLGMSFIYPLVVSVGFAMLDKAPADMYRNIQGISPDSYIYPTSIALIAISVATFIVSLPVSGGFIAAAALGALNLGYVGSALGIELQLFTGVLSDLRSVYASFATIMILAFFLPILEVMIVSAIVRSLSAAIGAETDISGIMRAF